jgi:hypothetical protein
VTPPCAATRLPQNRAALGAEPGQATLNTLNQLSIKTFTRPSICAIFTQWKQ